MKTTQKRWVSILLAILMIASTASVCLLSASAMRENRAYTTAKANVPDEVSSGSPARDDSGTCGENLTWTFCAETGELTISGTGRMDDLSNWYLAPWTSSNQDHIKTVTISDGVTTIGEYAFSYCINLTSVTIPDSVTKICNGAFNHCWNLADVLIPSGVTTIGEYAFHRCSSITSVTIPASVTEIGNSAFENCENLTAITVDANNPTYSNDAYGVLYNKDKTLLIQYPNGNTYDTFVIPDSVTEIGECAFLAFPDCSDLTSVTIPNSVTKIGASAFFGCSGLTDVTIPGSVKTIGASAFYGCSSLTSMTIPYGVEEIGDVAFCDCENLEFIHIPKSVKYISPDAFTTSPMNGVSGWLPLYICSSTADCYAKTYAEANGIKFRVCTDHGPAVTIRGFVPERTVAYRTTITFTAEVTKALDGAKVHWFVDGKDTGFTGETFTVKEAGRNFTVQAKYIKDGKVAAESGTEQINVRTGIFARILAFFRALFGKLPKIAQEFLGVEVLEKILP